MELKINEVAMPQKITFNYEELKQELVEKVGFYNGLVYTDEEIKQAKADKANLNKLKKSLNDERIRLEKEWMKPFDEFKTQVRDLIATIDEPVEAIDTQVKAYEEKQKQDKADAISQYWDSIEVPDWLDLNTIYDDKWLNASVTMKKVKEAIDAKIAEFNSNMEMLSKLPEFGFEAAEVYKSTLDVNKAITEAQRMSEMAKKKAEQEETERLAAEEKAKSVEISEPVCEEPIEQEEEPLPFTIPDAEYRNPWEEPCFIQESVTAITFKAVLAEEDKKSLVQWMNDRMIQFEIVEE